MKPRLGHAAGAYPGFRSKKRLGVFLRPLGWDASPSQATSLQFVRFPKQGSNPDRSLLERTHSPLGHDLENYKTKKKCEKIN